MKRYIRANTQKPKLDAVQTEWEEIDDGNGIKFTVYSDDGEVLFEEVFDYGDVDPDNIPESAFDMAIIALSQKYDLSDDAIESIKQA